MMFLKIIIFTVLPIQFLIVGKLRIELKSEALGVCGQMPEKRRSESSNRNFGRNRTRYRSLAIDLSVLKMPVESIDVRIVGGSDVQEPIPW